MALPWVLLPVSGSLSAVYECAGTEVARNTPSRKIYSPCSAGSTEASLHLNLLPFGFGFRSLPLCHTYFMFESMSSVWLHGQELLSFLSLLALIFYFITSPHPFLAFSMHAIEWNVPFYILDFWPEMRLCQSWTLSSVEELDFRAEISHWTQMANQYSVPMSQYNQLQNYWYPW